MSYRDEVLLIDVFHGDYAAQNCVRKSAEIAARADARIAELEQAVVIRDTEIARLETDLEMARRDAERYRWLRECGMEGDRAVHIGDELMGGALLDAAIDAARAGNWGEG